MDVIFASMTLDDVAAVAELEARCFVAPWTPDTFRHELQHNQFAAYWVLRPAAGATAGAGRDLPSVLAYGGYWLMGDEAHIVNVATHPDFLRRGLGERLVTAMVAEAQRNGAGLVTLEVRMSNQAAQQLYAKLGFVEVGERRRYYSDNGEDALLMTLFLENVPAPLAPPKASAPSVSLPPGLRSQ